MTGPVIARTAPGAGSVGAVPATPAAATAGPSLRPATTRPFPVDRLAALLGADVGAGDPAARAVTGVAFDSRSVRPGDLYVALPGARTHGARFVSSVLAAGAAAVLTDPAGSAMAAGAAVEDAAARTTAELPVLVVADPRAAMAVAAAEVYGRPAARLTMIGVTGTNGKTTTGYLLAAGLRAAGRRCGLIGTLGYFLDGRELAGDRTTVTTPESPDLQALLALMVEQGAEAVVMEVSSHALALDRADQICFDVAGFTNFGRDHLDFHGTVEAYFEAKSSLFTAEHARRAVINIDDARGPDLVARAEADGLDVATIGFAAARDPVRDHYRCLGHDPTGDPVAVRLDTPGGPVDFGLGLPGRYNVANAVMALAMLDRIGVPAAEAAPGLATATVPGRMQRVDLGSGAPRVYVDFAHTPQAVGSVLAELRAGLAGGRLIALLGCGGDRDRAKRGTMGAAAADLADVVVVTDDNPRSEDPAAIRAAVLAGARDRAADRAADRAVAPTVLDGGDRRSAIERALCSAGPADVVAVLGKGHERGQQVGDRVLPFDDVDQVTTAWRRRRTRTDSPEEGGS